MLKIPMRTTEAPPKDLAAVTEEAKLAFARYVVMHGTAEASLKLLIMMDRFLFDVPPKTADTGESNNAQASKLVTDGLRHFWSGEWQELAEDANIHCEAMAASREAEDTPAAPRKGSPSASRRPLRRRRPCAPRRSTSPRCERSSPWRTLVRSRYQRGADGGFRELWKRLEAQMVRDLRSLPRKSGPAMGSSKFEHWMGDITELRSLVAKVGMR